MQLGGLGSELDSLSQEYWNSRTAQFIEDFYNNFTEANEGIRGEILDVIAEVALTNQEVVGSSSGSSGGDVTRSRRPRSRIKKRNSSTRAFRISGDRSSRTRRAQDTNTGDGNNATTPYHEDCSDNPALSLVFTASLSYRTRGAPTLTVNDVIQEPFSTEAYRDAYVDIFLRQLEDQVFNNVTCSSRVGLPPMDTPSMSPAPSLLSKSPTSAPSLSLTSSLVPSSTANNGTMAPTPPPFSTSIRQDLEMDFFGLVSLSSAGQSLIADEMASYMNDFYNDSDGDDPTGLRASVSIVSSEVAITDQKTPTGSTSGLDCDLIDPVIITFTLQISYETAANGTDVDLDDVLTLPFDNEEYRQDFLEDYLRVNDVSGELEDLQCVNEIRLPTSAPSSMPTEYVDDIFGDMRTSVNPLSGIRVLDNERKCDKGMISPQNKTEVEEEFEVSFVYGVETSLILDEHSFLDDLEGLILDVVANSVLRCFYRGVIGGDSGGGVQSSTLRRGEVGDEDTGTATSVVRIRYPFRPHNISKSDQNIPICPACQYFSHTF